MARCLNPLTSAPGRTLRIVAAVFRNRAGDVLGVRKGGTSSFMMPGGKIESGETPREAVVREIAEELHLGLDADRLHHLGLFRAPAANEPGFTVRCDVYVWPDPLTDLPTVHDEIVEAIWVPVTSRAPEIAPLSRDVVFPHLRASDGHPEQHSEQHEDQ